MPFEGTRIALASSAVFLLATASVAGALPSSGTSALSAAVTVAGTGDRASRAAAADAAAARRLGLPPDGPDVLYAPPPHVPQLQNHDSRFRAPVDLVSGTERYLAGEYEYTDFLYDDDATTYPDDFARYAGNAGDLVELRLSTRDSQSLAVRFTLNTLKVPDSTIVALAFDADRNVATGSSTLPVDPGMPFPGSDHVLTTWGTGARWSTWTGHQWHSVALPVHTDTEANQITVTVPRSVARPTGRWRATLATGLYDKATGGWLALKTTTVATRAVPVSADKSSKIINLGFRMDEVPKGPPTSATSNGDDRTPSTRQDAALAAGQPTRFAHVIDFDLLRRRGSRSTVPTHGMMYRIFASRLKAVLVSSDADPAKGNPHLMGEGKDINSVHARFLSPLQPYAVYVPSRYRAGRPAPLTFSLHGDSAQYYWLNQKFNYAAQLFGEGRDSIVLAPAARGVDGFYVGHNEYDVFEAWNDVARHFTLDPRRTAMTGYSMGGYGAYRLGLLHPQLFARDVAMAPAICSGMWLIARCTGPEDTVSNRWLENARNLPIFHFGDVLSELTFFPGQAQQAVGPAVGGLESLDALGYRYTFWAVTQEHGNFSTNQPPAATFLGRNEIEPRPFHVTYARMPSNDAADVGLLHDRAYWLSGIQVRDAADPLAKGVVDAVSKGFGLTDPQSSQSLVPPGITAAGYPYTGMTRTWAPAGHATPQNRITLRVRNIRSVTIDPVAAHVDCHVKIDVDTDGPIVVKLLGCP